MTTALSLGNTSATSQPVFNSQAEFEKYEGNICERASDGCNTFGVEDGKITYGTEMACENHTPKWSCIDYKGDTMSPIEGEYIVSLEKGANIDDMIEKINAIDGAKYKRTIFDVGDTKMLFVKLDAPLLVTDLEALAWVKFVEQNAQGEFINNMTAAATNSISIHYGEITKIENGKDGVMIYVTDDSGTTYNTAVSLVTDTIKNGKFNELYLGTRVKVFYHDSVANMGLLIGDTVEIVSDGLSDNDRNYFNVLKGELNKDFQTKVHAVLASYTKKVEKYELEKRIEIHNALVERVERIISDMLAEFPQDIALPKDAAEKYSRLEFIKFSLMDIDFYAREMKK